MKDKIQSIIDSQEKSIVERYIEVYRCFLSKNDSDSYKVFKQIIELSSDVVDEEPEEEDSDLIRSVGNQYYGLLRELVSSISKLNLIPEAFYDKLYNAVFMSDIFPQRDLEQGVLLYFLARRIPLLPYFQATNPLRLEEDKFRMIIDGMQSELDRAVYMMNDRFDMRTEEASQLCDIADSLETRERKSVFWACILNANRKRGSSSDD